MKETFLVDVFYGKFYGPYTNKKIMERDRKLIKEVSDLCLEVASNVLVVEKPNIFHLVASEKYEHAYISEVETALYNITESGE